MHVLVDAVEGAEELDSYLAYLAWIWKTVVGKIISFPFSLVRVGLMLHPLTGRVLLCQSTLVLVLVTLPSLCTFNALFQGFS